MKSLSGKLDLSRVDLRCYIFDGLDLSYTDFSGAVLDGSSFIGTKLRGASFENASSRNSNFTSADLKFANLANSNFRDSNFKGAILIGANLKNSIMDGLIASGSDMRFANLSYASLTRSDLESSDMRLSNMIAANLECSALAGADFRGADQSYLNSGFSTGRESSFGLFDNSKRIRLFGNLSKDGQWSGFKYNSIDNQIIQGAHRLNYQFDNNLDYPAQGFLRSYDVDWFVDHPDGAGIFIFNRGFRKHKINLDGAFADVIVNTKFFRSNGARFYLHVFGENTRYALPLTFKSDGRFGSRVRILIDPHLGWRVTYVRQGYEQDPVHNVLKNAEFVGLMLLDVNQKRLPQGWVDLLYFELILNEEKMGKFFDRDSNNRPQYCNTGGP